jgi:hypothetical protein
VARPPKVVDIEPVGQGGCRRLILPLLLLIAAGAGVWYYMFRPKKVPPPPPSAIDVRSTVDEEGDSLRVSVTWRLVTARGPELPESVRVEIGVSEGTISQVATVPANVHQDTLRIPAPAAGQAASGYTCVAPMTRGRLSPESCTPWQFIRPSGTPAPEDSVPAGSPGDRRRTGTPKVSRIEIQPSGIQVDIDVDGRCAAWQRMNPGRSVWVVVNQKAIAECTGPNGKPTVAQFCAFAVLADGRRVKTLSADKLEYCDELFRKWREERTA